MTRLALGVALALTACGGGGPESADSASEVTASDTITTATQDVGQGQDGGEDTAAVEDMASVDDGALGEDTAAVEDTATAEESVPDAASDDTALDTTASGPWLRLVTP